MNLMIPNLNGPSWCCDFQPWLDLADHASYRKVRFLRRVTRQILERSLADRRITQTKVQGGAIFYNMFQLLPTIQRKYKTSARDADYLSWSDPPRLRCE